MPHAISHAQKLTPIYYNGAAVNKMISLVWFAGQTEKIPTCTVQVEIERNKHIIHLFNFTGAFRMIVSEHDKSFY